VIAAIILGISERAEPSARSKPKSSTTRPHPPSTAHEAVDDGTRITLFFVTCFVSAMTLEQASIVKSFGPTNFDGGRLSVSINTGGDSMEANLFTKDGCGFD
jgi:hypothetical protein